MIQAVFRILTLTPIVAAQAGGQELPVIRGVEPQPLISQASRLSEALSFLGSRLQSTDSQRLQELTEQSHTPEAVVEVQSILDRYCLAMVHINPESRVMALRGPAGSELIQEGWKSFLIKIHNEAGITARLEADSPNAQPLYRVSTNSPRPDPAGAIHDGELSNRFLDLILYRRRPLRPNLSGLELEYAVLQIYTRAVGKREARIGFHVGQGTQDIGFRGFLDVLFECKPSVKTTLRVYDEDGSPTMASFVIADGAQRVANDYEQRFVGAYPLPSRRLARDDEYPDFFFQTQVYRQDGEHVFLPSGTYEVTFTRGPEYIPQTSLITIPPGVESHEAHFRLKRWIHMAKLGWYSVDHHVHAAGCSHYESPAQGVEPADMWRQALGEDLNVACVLSWGPCWYYQKGFFDGKVHSLSTERNLMRFDVEVSGFPSSHAGHLCLLRLKEDDYPGTEEIEDWPSWTLPILNWAREQGGIAGYAHSGLGLEPIEPTTDLPNYAMAKFDGIGANEYIVTVTHGAVDFISAGDTPPHWELNIWYHTLNCGFRTRISGETDFPCLSDDRIGMARSYVRLPGALDFDQCIEQIRIGRSYVSDGASHIIDFFVNDTELGVHDSELRLDAPATVSIKARVAAHLSAQPSERQPPIPFWAEDSPEWKSFLLSKPFWDLEKARIAGTRRVPLELVLNGIGVARQEILADGSWQDVTFEWPIENSSWLALRIFPSSHTNPIFVLVDGRPIRASADSAKWCRAAVDRCWEMKKGQIRKPDQAAAWQAYDHARRTFDDILKEASASRD